MNMFEKRPLCLILCIGLGGFLLFSLENRIIRVALVGLAVLLGIISVILLIIKKSYIITLFSCAAILISSLCSFIYFDHYFKAYELYNEPVEIVGRVENVTQSSSYSLRLLVDVESINGSNNKGYRFYAYPTKAEASGIIEGTRISFKATLSGFSDESFSYNISRGINAYAGDIEDLTVLEQTDGSLKMRFARAKEYVTRYIIKLSNKDTGAILSALLLGERDYLPDQLRLDFKRIGISHILALSGMHLAIISIGLEKFLSFIRIKKKLRVGITAGFVVLYMALTGFSVSVVRAGLMLVISSALYLLSRSKDSLTSLSVAVTIICLISPNSIMDISLWLSALATFGIISFAEYSSSLAPVKTKKEKIKRYISLSILASIYAISCTMAISVISFGGISIFAPITTIIFSLLAEMIMYLGCFMLLIGWLLPVGWIIKPLSSLMTLLAGVFSSIKISYVSTAFNFVTVIVLVYTVLFYLFLILKLKKPSVALNVLVIIYVIVNIVPTAATVFENHKETAAYYSSSKCDQFVIRSENEVCLINSSQYSKNLAYTSLDLLEAAKVTYLDKYYLTHYSWSIDDELKVLMYNIPIDEVYIPEPRNEDEETILKIIYKSVENSRTKIVVFREYETVMVGDYSINLLYSVPYGNTSMNAFTVASGDDIYTYISSGLLASDEAEGLNACISLTDHLILGDHGKKYKEKIYLSEEYPDLENIIINSDNIFLTQDSMQYYMDHNYFQNF